jgi:hypothetical protein
MMWLFISTIVVFGCLLSFVGTLFVASDWLREVDETVRILPSENLSHAIVYAPRIKLLEPSHY